MSEGEYLFCSFTAWENSIVYFDNVGKLEGMQLLAKRHSAAYALLGIEQNLIPNDLAGDGNHLVGVTPRHVDATWLQELFCWDQTFR